jgi:hypothetical protein
MKNSNPPIFTFASTIMTSKKPMVLIAPEVLQRIQNDIDKDIDFKKVTSSTIVIEC